MATDWASINERGEAMPRLKRQRLAALVILMLVPTPVWAAAASVWSSAPKPRFPTAALSKGSEGHVIVRVFTDDTGRVTRANIEKSSGDASLDEAARAAILKWKMNPAAIKPEFRTKGYRQRIDFRQETPVAAQYRDRRAYFSTYESAKIWTYAPFPEYPFHERLVRTEGVAMVRITIGADGRAASVEIARSSGNANLDKAALSALRSWRAHKEYAGERFVVPIRFTLQGLR